MTRDEILARWRGGLIVSCQATPGSPLDRPDFIAAVARTVELNGAVGVRIDQPLNIAVVRAEVDVPIIGLRKQPYAGFDVYITPTYDDARAVCESGADVVAVDATRRERPGGKTAAQLATRLKTELGALVMADVATLDEGHAAAAAGFDFVSTTLAGYTNGGEPPDDPDIQLVERLAARLAVPVICEGRIRDPEDVRRAFDAGAFAVVVGNSITGIDALVRRFVAATRAR